MVDRSAKRRNISQDLFATSPSSTEDDNMDEIPITVVSSKSSQPSNSIVISDESETDALLLAVEYDELSAEVEVKKSPATKTTSPTVINRVQSRQLTLLEMLDQCYTRKSTGSPAKRTKS